MTARDNSRIWRTGNFAKQAFWRGEEACKARASPINIICPYNNTLELYIVSAWLILPYFCMRYTSITAYLVGGAKSGRAGSEDVAIYGILISVNDGAKTISSIVVCTEWLSRVLDDMFC